jgi:hypothetical protein
MTEVSEPAAPVRRVEPGPEPGGPRWVSPFGAIAAGFTAMCCLGVSAAVSLSTAVGATFLTRDSSLRPLLALTLVVTVAGSALTYWRRRRPWPLAVSVASAVWVYSFVYLVDGGHAGPMSDHMADHPATAPGLAAAAWPRCGSAWPCSSAPSSGTSSMSATAGRPTATTSLGSVIAPGTRVPSPRRTRVLKVRARHQDRRVADLALVADGGADDLAAMAEHGPTSDDRRDRAVVDSDRVLEHRGSCPDLQTPPKERMTAPCAISDPSPKRAVPTTVADAADVRGG